MTARKTAFPDALDWCEECQGWHEYPWGCELKEKLEPPALLGTKKFQLSKGYLNPGVSGEGDS